MNLGKDLTSFLRSAEKPLMVVLGPTASGKTALAVKIAHQINGEIISTDSRQIYKEIGIGTDIVLPEQQGGIPHHMLGVTTPDKPLTLAEYKSMALKIIDEIHERKHIPMLVGGTGLYISSIIEGYNVPEVEPDPKLRKKLEKEVKEKGAESIYGKLQKLDPEAAEKIHPNNVRYVIRAIEVAQAKKSPGKVSETPFDVFMIGLTWPREELYERVNLRVDSQIERGLVDEVKKLLDKGYKENLPSMSSLGVKEIIPYIKKKKSLEECVEILKRNTRRYAKRQMTWFRRYDNVRWLSPKKL